MRKHRYNIYLYISNTAGVVVFALGVLVLAGWLFNITLMKSVLPNLVTMKANTALCFALIGISLWLLQAKRVTRPSFGLFAAICAITVASIGALTLCEYIFKCDLGIDQFLFKEEVPAVLTMYPGRMALNTAVNFIVIGVALLMLDVRVKGGYFAAQILALIEGAIALMALLGYLYGVSAFYGGFAVYTAMALHTALAFIIISIGILFARPDSGVAGIFTSGVAGGFMLRQLAPALIILLIALGWLKINGERAGLFNNEFGTTLAVIGGIVLALVALLLVAGTLNRIDAKRKMVQDSLAVSGKEWLRTFNSISDAIFIIDKNNNILNANDALLGIFKKRPEEIIGKKCYEFMHNTHEPWPGCPLEKTKDDHQPHSDEVNDPNIGVPLLVTVSPIFDDKGEFIGAIHIARDISERKRAENALLKEKEEEQVILDSVPAFIFYKDRENRLMRVNKAFADIMQMSKEELEGKSVFDLFPREQAEASWRDDKEVMSSGKPKTNIIEFMDTGKGRLWVHTDKIPYRNEKGEIVGIIGFKTDITDRKLAEEALVKKVRDMEIFYRASVDREMKIKELKKKVRELEVKIRG